MKTSNNTILITGGSAGIGLALAKELIKENKVIIIGRNERRLEEAALQLPGVTMIKADVSSAEDVAILVKLLNTDYPELNVVINNAGAAMYNNLLTDTDTFERAQTEMHTNYLSVVRLNQLLIPGLQQQPEAAIVNVSSIAAFVPGVILTTYAASKAALHSYSQALRHVLKATTVKVFELMPPLVNTDFSAEIGGANGIPPAQVATEFMAAWETDNYEIRVAGTEQLYQLYLSSPADALAAMNSLR